MARLDDRTPAPTEVQLQRTVAAALQECGWLVEEQPNLGALRPDLLISRPPGRNLVVEITTGRGPIDVDTIARLETYADAAASTRQLPKVGIVLLATAPLSAAAAKAAGQLGVIVLERPPGGGEPDSVAIARHWARDITDRADDSDGSYADEGVDRDAPAVVIERGNEHPASLLQRLDLAGKPQPVVVVAGGAGALHEPELSVARATLGPAIRVAIARSGAAIIDGGTNAGVMALLGTERAADPAAMPVLIGVAPSGRVEHPGVAGTTGADRTPFAAHHTHLVLADSDEWGGETPLLGALATELASGEPVAMVLAGGGEGARAELDQAIVRGWPVFVLEGTGGLADRVAAAGSGEHRDPELEQALEHGDIRLTSSMGMAELGHALALELRDEPGLRDDLALKGAWGLFATYDGSAVRQRRTFERFQTSILVLGVVATAIALAHEEVGAGWLRNGLHWGAVVAPILVSVLIALANRRAAGKRWVLLRAAAEAVKSEIYRYRTRTGVYSRAALRAADEPIDRPRALTARLAEIDAGLVMTAASSGPLTPYDGALPPKMYGAEAQDDGLSRVDARRYITLRVADQLAYYRNKVADLDRLRARLQLVTLLAGGAGALLAAAGAEIWIGVTTALAGAALAHLGYLQVDNTIVAYNRAAAQLATLRREYDVDAAPDLERLVTAGETVLTTELSGWVQQMTDALAELQQQQSDAASKVERERDERAAATLDA